MKKWSEKTIVEKVARIISEVAFCIWILFRILFEKGVVHTEIVSIATIFVICISETISFWNDKRVISYIAIGGALCMSAAFVLLAL
ncbi:MAG: hypothetical protein IKU84_03210 [Clostridia bacterium]|nr:hypothetical protein [Clostridia bacterium]